MHQCCCLHSNCISSLSIASIIQTSDAHSFSSNAWRSFFPTTVEYYHCHWRCYCCFLAVFVLVLDPYYYFNQASKASVPSEVQVSAGGGGGGIGVPMCRSRGSRRRCPVWQHFCCSKRAAAAAVAPQFCRPRQRLLQQQQQHFPLQPALSFFTVILARHVAPMIGAAAVVVGSRRLLRLRLPTPTPRSSRRIGCSSSTGTGFAFAFACAPLSILECACARIAVL